VSAGSKGRGRWLIALITLSLGGLAPGALAATQTTPDPVGDAPSGPGGSVDVREVRWDGDGQTTSVTVRWKADPNAFTVGAPVAPQGGVWVDLGSDAIADRVLQFSASDATLTWDLR